MLHLMKEDIDLTGAESSGLLSSLRKYKNEELEFFLNIITGKVFLFFSAGIEPRASCMLGKHSANCQAS